jgi:hypothetical protein
MPPLLAEALLLGARCATALALILMFLHFD